MRLHLGLAAALFLSACSTGTDPALSEDPAYQLGYGDGCTTAQVIAQGGAKAVRRNPDYAGSDAYKAGWGAGYGACGGTQESLRRPGDIRQDDVGGPMR
ncbi:MAG: hypothetical protein HXY22_11450 [Alphaproteobacteria bacterium]|nr:hypothetical protein [Alphaproteobacteria bacterium]